jgi:hypothetical protein
MSQTVTYMMDPIHAIEQLAKVGASNQFTKRTRVAKKVKQGTTRRQFEGN